MVMQLGVDALTACVEPRRRDLFDHIPPAGAALHRKRGRPAVGATRDVVAQPTSEPVAVLLPHPAAPLLARLELHHIERDLASMQIQSSYLPHLGPPHSCTDS
jgi:hypothetical protein